jgi:uncharacterized protein (DUF1330 family)
VKRPIALGLALLAGASVGTAAVRAVNAQAQLPAYVIFENAPTDRDPYAKEFVPLAQKSVRDYGGKFLRGGGALQGAKSLSISGEPPRTIILFQFESLDKAKTWANSSAWKDLVPIGQKYTSYFRVYVVEGLPQ